jgi:LmbE family N-acetylglucosaminyl deacetylase
VYTPVILLKTTVRSIKALLQSRQYIFLLFVLLAATLLGLALFTRQWVLAVAGTVLLGVSILMGLRRLYHYIHDRTVPLQQSLLQPAWARRAMVIFPHADDEFTVAGTIRMLVEQQVSVTLVYLTKGNAGVTAGLTQADNLVATRSREMEYAKQILGASHLEMLVFEDGQLALTDPEVVRNSIRGLLAKYQPSIVLTYDTQSGLYGHADHITTAQRVLEVCREATAESTAASVRRIYCVTLPPPMLRFYLLMSPIFQLCFHKFAQSLPAPDFAVPIRRFASVKKKVILAHRTQWRVLELLLPLFYLIPASWYFRFFDREYFSVLFQEEATAEEATSLQSTVRDSL